MFLTDFIENLVNFSQILKKISEVFKFFSKFSNFFRKSQQFLSIRAKNGKFRPVSTNDQNRKCKEFDVWHLSYKSGVYTLLLAGKWKYTNNIWWHSVGRHRGKLVTVRWLTSIRPKSPQNTPTEPVKTLKISTNWSKFAIFSPDWQKLLGFVEKYENFEKNIRFFLIFQFFRKSQQFLSIWAKKWQISTS